MIQVRIFLIDDHQVIRDGLRVLIERNPAYKVVAEASSGKEALEKVASVMPDIVLLDLSMPGMNGMETARELSVKFPAVKVIILSMHNDFEYITKCLEHDVMGYVVKNEGGNEVINAIAAVATGKKYYSEAVARTIMEKYTRQVQLKQPHEEMIEVTNREKQVMQYIAQGYTNQRIADTLFISTRTVETHRANLMRKLDAKNSIELVNKARERNLVS